MRTRAVPYLRCPGCVGMLTLSVDRMEAEEVLEGHLRCNRCSARYPIQEGIPNLASSDQSLAPAVQQTVDRFGAEWNDFDFIAPHYDRQFQDWIAPNPPSVFKDQVVLEGGCGKGRHSRLVAQYGAKEVFAVDLGSAVQAAYRNTREFPNVHVIQADLFRLPFAPDTFDIAFSVGVIHHTPEPERCFQELAKRVKPGGRVIAWVYGYENNAWIRYAIDPLRTRVTSKLPHRWVYQLSKVPAHLVSKVSRFVYEPLSRPPFAPIGRRLFYQAYLNALAKLPFEEVHAIVHDHLTPPIAYYITQEEFRSWFDKSGLRTEAIEWHNENSWRGTGVRPTARP
jgi:SAM-dependent methyltransferase/uncharacterized protein YbaR (Trm112 family)